MSSYLTARSSAPLMMSARPYGAFAFTSVPQPTLKPAFKSGAYIDESSDKCVVRRLCQINGDIAVVSPVLQHVVLPVLEVHKDYFMKDFIGMFAHDMMMSCASCTRCGCIAVQ